MISIDTLKTIGTGTTGIIINQSASQINPTDITTLIHTVVSVILGIFTIYAQIRIMRKSK